MRHSRAMRRTGIALTVLTASAVAVGSFLVAAPTAAAQETSTELEAFLADGTTPAQGKTVHTGDTIVVKGRGFDVNANTEGLPVPVPPGVPHGVFVTYGAFSPHWRPSQGAPSEARGEARPNTAWVMSEDALNRVPSVPFDLRRTIRQQWVPLNADGTFTAHIKVSEVTKAPADAQYGIYSYAAANAVNAAEEHFIPVPFDPAPGPNTPATPPSDLSWGFAPGYTDLVKNTLKGGFSASDGAAVKGDQLTFSLVDSQIDPATGLGVVHYKGTLVSYARFHLLDIAIANPWIEYTPEGTFLSADASTSYQNGTDQLSRVRLAKLDVGPNPAARELTGVGAHFDNLQPWILLPYKLGSAAPVSFRY